MGDEDRAEAARRAPMTPQDALARLLAVRPLMDGGPTDALCAAIDDLMAALDSEDIAGIVADAVARGLTTLAHAEYYLGVATWSGTENGASMQRTLEAWLRAGDDPLRVHLALHAEVYPFPDAVEMAAVLAEVARRLPRFRERCAELIARRPR